MDLIHSTERFSLVNLLNREYYDKEHIPSSINIPIRHLNTCAPRLLKDKDELIVLYCSDERCPSGEDGTRKLRKLGYRNVVEFSGGLEAWKKRGYPVVGTPELPKAA